MPRPPQHSPPSAGRKPLLLAHSCALFFAHPLHGTTHACKHAPPLCIRMLSSCTTCAWGRAQRGAVTCARRGLCTSVGDLARLPSRVTAPGTSPFTAQAWMNGRDEPFRHPRGEHAGLGHGGDQLVPPPRPFLAAFCLGVAAIGGGQVAGGLYHCQDPHCTPEPQWCGPLLKGWAGRRRGARRRAPERATAAAGSGAERSCTGRGAARGGGVVCSRGLEGPGGTQA